MQWFAQAPANIALIKYMGKNKPEHNLPSNPSLSYTLDALQSSVMLTIHNEAQDCWQALTMPETKSFELSLKGQTRFLDHLSYLKTQFNYSGSFVVKSNNNFPQGSGLASSASSFAALTKCAVLALSELTQRPLPTIETIAQWSRRGSGSSCRSFFEPWVLWDGEQVGPITLPYPKLIHQAIIISASEKEISSSLAHKLVQSSPQFATRAQRARNNLDALVSAFNAQNWRLVYEICWQEFHDMHQLFSSCQTPFCYITDESQKVLNQLEQLWKKEDDGPIVTMDAGPNIHLLWRQDQIKLAKKFTDTQLLGQFNVL